MDFSTPRILHQTQIITGEVTNYIESSKFDFVGYMENAVRVALFLTRVNSYVQCSSLASFNGKTSSLCKYSWDEDATGLCSLFKAICELLFSHIKFLFLLL